MKRADVLKGHPNDVRLMEAYFDGAPEDGEGIRRHIEDCDACRQRYLRLTETLDVWQAAATAEADDVFTEARLERQRHRILSRLIALSRGARILPFPVTRPRTFGPSPMVVMKRWVALAAAAGLLVGLALGRLSSIPRQQETASSRGLVTAHMTSAGGAPLADGVTTVRGDRFDDEQLLMDVEDSVARDRSRIRALQDIDQLTPRVRTAVAQLR